MTRNHWASKPGMQNLARLEVKMREYVTRWDIGTAGFHTAAILRHPNIPNNPLRKDKAGRTPLRMPVRFVTGAGKNH
jgi:hypothetical protein